MRNRIVTFFLLIACPFIFSACEQPQNTITPPNLYGHKLELKRLSDELFKLLQDGSEDYKVLATAKQINKISELVIEGKVIALETSGTATYTSDLYSGYMIIEVGSVKKGSYPHREIRVLFGMASTYWSVMLYPGYVKTKYHSGDRVRVYLNYIDELAAYTAVGGYYSIQPMVNFNIFKD